MGHALLLLFIRNQDAGRVAPIRKAEQLMARILSRMLFTYFTSAVPIPGRSGASATS